MRIHSAFLAAPLLAAALLISVTIAASRASDHADPMSLNVLKVQDDPEANITDLHAFVVDRTGRRIVDPSRIGEGTRLVISLCARRALLPDQAGGLELKGNQFVLHLDLDPVIQFFDEAKTRDGGDYAATLAKLSDEVTKKAAAVAAIEEKAKAGQAPDPKDLMRANVDLQTAIANRGALIDAHETDRSMQALYGGIFPHPDAIAENATVEFELDLDKSGAEPQAILTRQHIEGIPGKVNVLPSSSKVAPATKDFQPGEIYIQTGIFDDPFIFPRFFRKNVVGIVISIPLTQLPKEAAHGPMLLWATTHHAGVQIDHVGRSLRSQLPRFGYLNTLHPAEHVRAITRVHAQPDVLDNVLATFLAPLEAHRHYDSVPDVMVYDLGKPAKFPNGRGLEDDVSASLAAAGETLLLELSYAESRQFPRATTNDKQFLLDFPYLAPRWTNAEIKAYSASGVTVPAIESVDPALEAARKKTGLFVVPTGPDSAAIASPNLLDTTWRTLWLVEVISLLVLAVLLIFTVRSCLARAVVVIVTVIAICMLHYVYAANIPGMLPQPPLKLWRLIYGALVIAALAAAWLFALGRRSCTKWPHGTYVYPEGRQEVTPADLEESSSYQEIQTALFDERVNEQYYRVWGSAGDPPLPRYKQTFANIASGLLRFWTDFAMLKAARRTLKTRIDLRWERKGFHRLVHPLGICLEGEWQIDRDAETSYSGYFAAGKKGRVIARYSLGGNDPRNGHYRSLGMVGKVFPMKDVLGVPTPRAHFITQEDLGGALTESITKSELTNSPPVTLWRRGIGLLAFLVVIKALTRADEQPAERQLYEIAELEKPEDTMTKCPRFMRLTVEGNPSPLGGEDADFRDEILGLMYDPGQAEKKRNLVYKIEVSDVGERVGKLRQRLVGQEWKRIGTLTFTKAVASRTGDFVIHFHHPVWRKNPNDPGSVVRPDLKS